MRKLALLLVARQSTCLWPGSQGDQDDKLRDIFERIGVTNRFFVEFGYIEGSVGSNTWRLRVDDKKPHLSARKLGGPWRGLLMGMQIKRDRTHPSGTQVRRTWISSRNIVSLFAEGEVPVSLC